MPTSDGLIAIGDEWSAYGQGMVGECHSPNDLEVACCALCITHTVYYTLCKVTKAPEQFTARSLPD